MKGCFRLVEVELIVGNVMPKVSVIIPCYNHGEFLLETLYSLQEQTFTDYEIIIVNDGSTDEATVTLLQNMKRPKTRIFNTVNNGVSAARNRGITEAVGQYILPLDADDLITPQFLEKTVSLLEQNPETGIVSCDAELFGMLSEVRQLPDFSLEHLLSENLLFATSVFRKSNWKSVGGYRTAMKFGWEDWDFWIAMARSSIKVIHIPEPLFKYRISSESRDRSMTLWQKLNMMLLILVKHFKCYLKSPMSLIRLLTNAWLITERRMK